MSTHSDHRHMALAIQLARRGWYGTSPNPRVGCVLVKDDHVIADGWHSVAGGPHAEAVVLEKAGQAARGATAYVSLEPCSHHGKTPPCADALINAGIKRLVYGMRDPNPDVAGRGLEKLRQAGITVDGPLLEQNAQSLNPGFIRRMQTGKPWVIGKTAASLDGRTAMANGESQWITGAEARADVQKLRAASCAIITGIGTVLADNPQLTVRNPQLAEPGMALRQPLRVIVDSRLRIPTAANVLQSPGKALVVYARAEAEKLEQLARQGTECVQLANSAGQVDLPALLAELGKRECNEVMVEAGSTLLGAMLQLQLINQLQLYTATTLLGSNARPLAQLPLDSMAQQQRWQLQDIRRIGNDVRWQLLAEKGTD